MDVVPGSAKKVSVPVESRRPVENPHCALIGEELKSIKQKRTMKNDRIF